MPRLRSTYDAVIVGDEIGSWGVETDDPAILVCGAGARRGGAVSAIAGHNAAMAVLCDRSSRP